MSKLLQFLSSELLARQIVEKVKKKFEKLPNTGHMQLWLQRISYPISKDVAYDEPLCKLACGASPVIWNNEWISSNELRRVLKPETILDRRRLGRLSRVVPVKELSVFIARNDYD